MDAFDASGHPTQPGQATPLLARSRPSATGAPSGTGLSLSKGLDTGDRNHALRSKPPHPPPHEDQGDDSLSHLSEQQLREKVWWVFLCEEVLITETEYVPIVEYAIIISSGFLPGDLVQGGEYSPIFLPVCHL